MVGLQLGTLIAQIVIIGDLGPAIVSKATGLQVSIWYRKKILHHIKQVCVCVRKQFHKKWYYTSVIAL